MNCPNCNNPLNPNQKFCSVCGAPAAQAPVNTDNAPQNNFAPSPQEYPAPSPQEYPAPSSAQGAAGAFAPEPPQQNNYAQPYAPQPPYGAPQGPGGSGNQPPKKSNTPLIIVIVVLAVLLVGGGIFTAIMLLNKDKGDEKKDSTTTQSTSASSDASSKAQSSLDFTGNTSQSSSYGWDDSSSSSQSSYGRDDSSSDTQSSYVQDSSSAASVNHKVINSSGIVLADDPAINADDEDAEDIINDYFSENSELADVFEQNANGLATAKIYGVGNAMVVECTMTIDLNSAQTSAIADATGSAVASLQSMLSGMRSEVGVDDMVVVIAYLEKDGTYISGGVAK